MVLTARNLRALPPAKPKLRPLIGSMHPVLLILTIIVCVSLLSEVASNTAVATLALPIVREGAI